MCVAVHTYKKKNGVYPSWYISNGYRGKTKIGDTPTLVDLAVLLELRQNELDAQVRCSTDYYWRIRDNMKMRPSNIARYMAINSTIYKSMSTWLTFMHHELFCEPIKKFSERVTRLSEFDRLCKQLIKEYDNGVLDERYFKTWKKVETQKI